jgi:spermidine synthase
MTETPHAQRIAEFVADWYRALDEHAALADVQEYLVADGLSMTFPEATLTTSEAFAGWYDAVTHRFFDEAHEVTSVVSTVSAGTAEVRVVVNWQARIWDPPAPTSQWLGFDAYQTWRIVQDDTGKLKIASYRVDELKPMPGSAQL